MKSPLKVAGLGLPGVILVVTMAATGLTGAAAITAALAFLEPAGMLGGIAVLGLTGLIADALTKVGLEDLLTAIYCQRRLSEPHGKLLEEIEKLSLFDGDIKERLQMTVTEGCGCAAATIVTNMDDITGSAIAILQAVPGMTPAHHRDFKSSHPIMRLRDGTAVRAWKNPVGVDHIFLVDLDGRMIYGGYVGWIHSEGLNQALSQIRSNLT